MRRVVVPLDGSWLSESILPDAKRVAGTDGELLLVCDASRIFFRKEVDEVALGGPLTYVHEYLEGQAELLRAEGVRVDTKTMYLNDAAVAIDEGAKFFDASLIACATHGRGPFSRLVRGGVAWRALANSTVPVLIRHAEEKAPMKHNGFHARRILVPLDGSKYAEKALPVAQEFALEWDAPLYLIDVVPELPASATLYIDEMVAFDYAKEVESSEAYLETVAAKMPGDVIPKVYVGAVVEKLIDAVDHFHITDIVMATHGRTGLSRVVLGSVADALLHRLHLPMIIIPALAPGAITEVTESEEEIGQKIPVPV